MKSNFLFFLVLALLRLPVSTGYAQIPVTDVANLTNNTVLHAENIAKWVESINNLRTQIDQLNRQINIQDDIRRWSGNPAEAGATLALDSLGQHDLVRTYGRTKDAILGLADSLGSLKRTASGSYRAISDTDLKGGSLQRDPLQYRRYSVLDATQENADQVTSETKTRADELQAEIAVTMEDLKAAPTDAEVQKLSAKLSALNGQLAQVETERRREVDAVLMQKVANDSRLEEERMAAAELAAKNDYLANQRISAYMKTIKLRKNDEIP